MTTPTDLVNQAFQIANAAVVCDIESYGVKALLCGYVFYDTRHWVDPRENSAEKVDMARLAIDYALASNLAVQHPQHPHMLRILAARA